MQFHSMLPYFRFAIIAVLTSTAVWANEPKPDLSDADICVKAFDSEHWIDKSRAVTHTGMCKTVMWFDRLFGHDKAFNDEEFGGKLVLGLAYSERDGFKERIRVRIKSKLPNASSRVNAFIGRVDEDAYVSDSKAGNPDSIAKSGVRNSRGEDEWLIGLGYSNPKNRKKGFDYSTGIKLSSGISPYAKARYYYNFEMPSGHYSRAAQTFFWRRDEGYGTTTSIDYFYELGYDDLLKLDSSITYTKDNGQWESYAGLTWFHRLQTERGVAAKIYFRGEEEHPASKIPEYGINLSYRRPLFREWLYIETGVNGTWYKDDTDVDRQTSYGVGVQFEMLMGQYKKIPK